MREADLRVKRTRKLLRDALQVLLEEKSFHAITVQEIAERAMVNRATFYAHYVDKYALLDQVVREQFREALTGHVTTGAPFNADNLLLLIIAVFESIAQMDNSCRARPKDLHPLVESAVQQEIYDFLMDWLAQLPAVRLEEGATRETTVTVMSWAIFGASVTWSRGPRAASAETMARQVLHLLTSGLSHILSDDLGVSGARWPGSVRTITVRASGGLT